MPRKKACCHLNSGKQLDGDPLPHDCRKLPARDAKRDIGAELLLLSVQQMKAGKGKAVARVQVPAICTLPRRNCAEDEPGF